MSQIALFCVLMALKNTERKNIKFFYFILNFGWLSLIVLCLQANANIFFQATTFNPEIEKCIYILCYDKLKLLLTVTMFLRSTSSRILRFFSLMLIGIMKRVSNNKSVKNCDACCTAVGSISIIF